MIGGESLTLLGFNRARTKKCGSKLSGGNDIAAAKTEGKKPQECYLQLSA